MKISGIVLLIIVLIAGMGWLRPAAAQAKLGSSPSADSLFKEGKFAEAEKSYSEALQTDPRDLSALVRLGFIALLSNRFDDAEKWLKSAMSIKSDDPAPKSLLAEAYFRRDDFARAAPLFRAVGELAKAEQLESFADLRPCPIEGPAGETSLPFVMTDPLPVVQVKVNGHEAVNFFIDTGAGQVILDTAYAREIGAAQFGSENGTFAGGKTASYQFGRVDSATLGDFTVKNLPVQILDVRRFSQPVFGGKRVDGIIGTVLLYHFLATLDYPGGNLVLRRPAREILYLFEEEARARKLVVLPFWMAGDHFMVAWGSVNARPPSLFFVDTGLAGGGFSCPASTLKDAGIKPVASAAAEGIGGGGKVRIVPFVVQELALGEAREQNVPGLFLGPFPLEYAFGFRIGGLISHGFFRNFALTFDFNRMRIYLEKRQSKTD